MLPKYVYYVDMLLVFLSEYFELWTVRDFETYYEYCEKELCKISKMRNNIGSIFLFQNNKCMKYSEKKM